MTNHHPSDFPRDPVASPDAEATGSSLFGGDSLDQGVSPAQPPRTRLRLPRTRRIQARDDFQRVYAEGRRAQAGTLVVFAAPRRPIGADSAAGGASVANDNDRVASDGDAATLPSRLGVTASRKTGKAHDRNRAKRLVRESWRHLIPRVRNGFDIVVNTRAATARIAFGEAHLELEQCLTRLGLLAPPVTLDRDSERSANPGAAE